MRLRYVRWTASWVSLIILLACVAFGVGQGA